jgi:hypothetical protein
MRITAIPALPWAVESAYMVSLVLAPKALLSCLGSLASATLDEKNLCSRLYVHEHDFDGGNFSAVMGRIDEAAHEARLLARVKCSSRKLWRRIGCWYCNENKCSDYDFLVK